MKTVLRATKTHALNLAKFVSLYKTLLLLQKSANGGKERDSDSFIAGLIGGYIVFGERTAINEQVRDLAQCSVDDRIMMSTDRSLCVLTSRGLLHPPGYISSYVEALWKTSTTKRSSVFHLRCLVLGCSDVAIQIPRRNASARHVQLHDISVPRFRAMAEPANTALA
jgi:hypothetical protein